MIHGASSHLTFQRLQAKFIRKYGEAVVVFDGYEGTSTKDMTNQRRAVGMTGPTVTFDEDMSKDEFIVKNTNKQQFINIPVLSCHLKKKTSRTFYAKVDADLLIVQLTMESATTTNIVLIGDETDLRIVLIYHANLDSLDLFFFEPEPKKSTKDPRVWNIKVLKQQLDARVCIHILFMHATSGCDTTSRLYGIGKDAALKKFITSYYFREQATVFGTPSASTTDVEVAGQNALVCLYNEKPGDSTFYG
ncbi:hypothetical protein MAR_024408 [Mya arenaria]|uniref:Uncharacterized protein n=1 Tax=Mya arenaria TaxID=6604 RepID=A0ABY7DTN5_MYAAR|nr:hypothetical protein MAR_024408 [Mya arenaria]